MELKIKDKKNKIKKKKFEKKEKIAKIYEKKKFFF
jgi:hypothetical protein